MTAKERVMTALNFGVPDRPPIFAGGFWSEFAERWRREKGLAGNVSPEDHYGLDLRMAAANEAPFPSAAARLSDDGHAEVRRDAWGRTVRGVQGAFFTQTLEVALAEKRDLDQLVFESPELDSRYTGFVANVGAWRERFCTFCKVGGPYLRSSFLRGGEQWLLDLATDQQFASELARRVADHLMAVGLESLRRGDLYDTGIWIYDDMATNRAPAFSPKVFERVFLPQYRRMVACFKQAGAAKVILHCDGNLAPLLEMLIDVGIDGINPVEPRAGLDIAELRATHGERLAFVGGLCNSQILPSGDPPAIKAHALRLRQLALQGGVVPASHSIGPDISTASWELALRVLRG